MAEFKLNTYEISAACIKVALNNSNFSINNGGTEIEITQKFDFELKDSIKLTHTSDEGSEFKEQPPICYIQISDIVKYRQRLSFARSEMDDVEYFKFLNRLQNLFKPPKTMFILKITPDRQDYLEQKDISNTDLQSPMSLHGLTLKSFEAVDFDTFRNIQEYEKIIGDLNIQKHLKTLRILIESEKHLEILLHRLFNNTVISEYYIDYVESLNPNKIQKQLITFSAKKKWINIVQLKDKIVYFKALH